jgi:hypothetical protein
MNKIPTRCSNSILFYFPLFSALHVLGVTITHHQELPLYIQVWCNNINRSLSERSVCQNRVGWVESVARRCRLYVCQSLTQAPTHVQATSPSHTLRLADPVLAHAALRQETIYIVLPYPNVQWKLLMMGDCDTRNM